MNEPARQQFPDPAPNERAGAASRPRRTAAAPPPDSIEEILAQTDKIRAEHDRAMTEYARAAAEHDRAMAEYARAAAERNRAAEERQIERDRIAAERAHEAAERQAERDQKMAEYHKKNIKTFKIAVILAMSVQAILIGGLKAFLTFRDQDIPTPSPVIIQYLSPQTAQPPDQPPADPAPATATPN